MATTKKKKATKKKVVRKKVTRKKVAKKKSTTRKAVARKKAPAKKTIKKTASSRKGTSMAKRKKRRSYRKTAKRAVSRVRRAAGTKLSMMDMLTRSGIGVGVDVAASIIAGKLPIQNEKGKALGVAGLGMLLGLSKMGRGKFASQAAVSLVQTGIRSFLKQQFPQLPFMTGDAVDYIEFDDNQQMGIISDAPSKDPLMGIIEDEPGINPLDGEDEFIDEYDFDEEEYPI